jgi:hypothetical protein
MHQNTVLLTKKKRYKKQMQEAMNLDNFHRYSSNIYSLSPTMKFHKEWRVLLKVCLEKLDVHTEKQRKNFFKLMPFPK